MSTSLKSPRFGRRGAGFSLTVAVLVFSLIGLSTIVGCKKHNDPVSPDQSSGIPRLGQAFSSPEEWDTAYSLDSSTSTWTYPCISSLRGEIATEDGGPLITAFVRHDSGQIGSGIHLVLKDASMVSVYWEDFSFAVNSGAIHQEYEFCRHPAVEVTYSNPTVAGQLAVHIVWAELIGEHPNEQWDIIYRYLEFDPEDEETPRVPLVDVYRKLTNTSSSHEIQPDLCVYYPEGDLYAAYLTKMTGPTRWGIHAVRLQYDDQESTWDPYHWESAGTVAAVNDTGKAFPSIDAGYFSPVGEPEEFTWQVAVVWSQLIEGTDDAYEILYNAWAPPDTAYAGDAVRISPDYDPQTDVGAMVLPKIEVLPCSSWLNEAVIAWGWECANGGCPRKNIWMVVTPFIGPDDYPVYVLDPDLVSRIFNKGYRDVVHL